ncbi:uncharacterized protein SPPG_07514 [Spizellomyces punctatus DAOM BR117]|uniref:GH16 domain-containing protein n=1 Tax=Spizellomyces punctatus (strain DAOM BR117) TaxID=645134 RepID=A0A0L0H861_SPIPD|nr:uncharacterized protein SPPG_07514 [Spizellomyces punctatus DAOM BR117]KNC97121.1 hypothetical protein SPPG_07514 [Spizellomyces punctatus DAOM BR117]|eukprot:XP_016605161.1 hypothetical protein SPPG_07514 [Spizellomyces punctatus DAOM BR117]
MRPYTPLLTLLLLPLASTLTIIPNITGNCVSGTYPANDPATWLLTAPPSTHFPTPLNPSIHHFIAQSNAKGIRFTPTGAALDLHAPPSTPLTRAAHTRYILYGRISINITASPAQGICTSLTTLSDTSDELDIELIGKKPLTLFTNIFYKGRQEFTHGTSIPLSSPISETHLYELDWKPESVTWLVDGRVVRYISRGAEDAKSRLLNSGENWFPDTPSQVWFGIWQGAWAGEAQWTDGGVRTSEFGSLVVQCYDGMGTPVPEWPVGAKQFVYGEAQQAASTTSNVLPCKIYTAHAGETCQDIALASNITPWTRIEEWNPGMCPPQEGTELCISEPVVIKRKKRDEL